MLSLKNITCRIAGRTLLESTSATLFKGNHLGLVGANGCGKTTLFRLISQEISPDAGEVLLDKNIRIGQVAQETPEGQQSLIDFVLAADMERSQLMQEAENTCDANRIAAIHTRLNDINAYTAESRAGAILHGLGFNAQAQRQSLDKFSGGWRMRVALAACLFSEPDLLLLDEPTNYLDLEGTIWLEKHISQYSHTVIIISHDRNFLNRCVTSLWHIEQQKLWSYRGNYDQFEHLRYERQMHQGKLREKQLAERRHMENFITRFRAKATKARQAQSRLKALQKLAPVTAIIDERLPPIHLPDPAHSLSPPILTLEDVSIGYEAAKPVLEKLNLRVDPEDRIGLIGANGEGKSTLARLLSARLHPLAGKVIKNSKLGVAYFAQHQMDELKEQQNAVEHLRPLLPYAGERDLRAKAAGFGLIGERMETNVGNLSGGEKTRLLLGLISLNRPNLLILDEPTNHLDIDARAALVQAINDYQGAVIVISHDQFILENCVDQLWLVDKGRVRPFDGDMADYSRFILSTRQAEVSERENKPLPQKNQNQAKARRQQSAELRARLLPLKKKIKNIEYNIEKHNKKINFLDEEMGQGNLYSDNPEKIATLSRQRAYAQKELKLLEEDWLILSEEIEQIQDM